MTHGKQTVRVPNKPPYMPAPVIRHDEIHDMYTDAIKTLKRSKIIKRQLFDLWEAANKAIIIYMKKSFVVPRS